jgi:hypothetical protein
MTNVRTTRDIDRVAITHCDHLQPTKLSESPCLANGERAVIVQLGFVYEPTPIIGFYEKHT